MKYKLFFPSRDLVRNMHRMMPPFSGVTALDMEPYELVYEGDIHPSPAKLFSETLEYIWERHNVGTNLDGNRPRATEIRSMCVGDIIEIVGEYWMADSSGFKQLIGAEVPSFKQEAI